MPVAVKPIIDRNLPPIYKSYDTYEDKDGNLKQQVTYIFCIPFQNADAIGEDTYNRIYARISGISGYSYAIRPPYVITPINDIKEDYLKIVTEEPYSVDPEFAETYFSESLSLLEKLGKVAKDQNYIICVDPFPIDDDKINLNPRQFYKVQLAYGYTDETYNIEQISAYSDYGIAKCVSQDAFPIIVKMQGLSNDGVCLQTTQDLVGEFYSQDLGERVVEYRFNIMKLHDDNDIIYTTGWLPHNSASDTISASGDGVLLLSSTDTAPMKKNLKLDQIYQVQYEVYTTNKIYKSQKYAIVNQAWGANDFPGRLVARAIPETGEIELSISQDSGAIARGMYRIERATEDQSYNNWEPVCELRLYNSSIDEKVIYKDRCVEQGRKYKYSVYKYVLSLDDREIRTQRFYTRPITAQFEDMFLSDGERQLNIRFNPKVSTFKTVKLENKIDTIGGKYPFLSRNGHTNYKQFAISGLISVLMDDQMTFWADPQYNGDTWARTETWSQDDGDFKHFHSTNLESWNITRERDFKLDVLDWLNDGKPKLLRTPAEGNYIVALQGVSLSPMDQLGRMLHTFSATAYEIDDLTSETLKKYNMSGTKVKTYYKTIFDQNFKNITYHLKESKINSIVTNDDPYSIQSGNIFVNNNTMYGNISINHLAEESNEYLHPNLLHFFEYFGEIDIPVSTDALNSDLTNIGFIYSKSLNRSAQVVLGKFKNSQNNIVCPCYISDEETDFINDIHLISDNLILYFKIPLKNISNDFFNKENISYIYNMNTIYCNGLNEEETSTISNIKFIASEGNIEIKTKRSETNSVDLNDNIVYQIDSGDIFSAIDGTHPLDIQLDSENNKVYEIEVKDTDDFQIILSNYTGPFQKLKGDLVFSYLQILLDQRVTGEKPLCIYGNRHLPSDLSNSYENWLEENQQVIVNSIYQLRISKKQNATGTDPWDNWLWDATALDKNHILAPSNLTSTEKNDIILAKIDKSSDEVILTQEDLDDVTILMAGKNLQVELAYLYANTEDMQLEYV